MTLHKACSKTDIGDDGRKVVEVNGISLLIIRIGDNFHAIKQHCPHAGEDLAGGVVEGKNIVCPRHEGTFSLETGKFIDNGYVSPALARVIKDSTVFSVTVDGNDLLVEM